MNNRVIKFRAWDGKQMYEEVGAVQVDARNGKLGTLNRSIQDIVEADMALMQFTGLKDKDGKEIYEGDVLRKAGIVAWNDVEVRWSCIDIEWNNRREWHDMLYLTTPLEVIGNIYENPTSYSLTRKDMTKELNCIGCGKPGCDGKTGCDWYDRKVENRDKAIETIRAACIRANSELIPNARMFEIDGASRKIGLCDVLLAIWKQKPFALTNIHIELNGNICLRSSGEENFHVAAMYDLHQDDLTQQSDECVAFINSVLTPQ